jgi:hypothetical protein
MRPSVRPLGARGSANPPGIIGVVAPSGAL